jgi:signal transduction histidine kinase
MSDAMLLEGAVCNLVRNALKYTPPGGRIVVGCRPRGAVVRIEVHDNGIGIPADQLSKIFEAFHRVNSTRPDGLGLGLFIVRRAVDLLGHRIAVRSSMGRGTCFTVLAKAVVPSGVAHIPANQSRISDIYLSDSIAYLSDSIAAAFMLPR